MKPRKKKRNPALLLPALLACGGALLAWAWLMSGQVWNRLIFLNGDDAMMDFFNCVAENSTLRVYEEAGSIYPPLGNLVYFGLSKLVPQNLDAIALSKSAEGTAVYFVYTVVTLVTLAILVSKLVAGNRTRRFAAGALCLVTEPVVYAVERGNIVLWAAALCAAFLLWYRSTSRVKRELALICLAMAANLKIYPAVLGVLLLSDKAGRDKNPAKCKKLTDRLTASVSRWKDALRCAGYALALYLIPFAFMGGVPAFLAMFESIVSTSNQFFESGFAYKIEFRNTLGILHTLVTGETGLPAQTLQSVQADGRGLVLLSVFFFPLLQGHWRKAAMLCALAAGIPGFSYQYNLVFMLPAAALFFNVEFLRFAKASKSGAKQDRFANFMTALYAILFAAMFVPMPFATTGLMQSETLRTVSLSVLVSGTGLLLMPVVLIAEGAVHTAKVFKAAFFSPNKGMSHKKMLR